MRVETRVQSAWLQRLKLKCDKLLSGYAFEFNLRRYIKDGIDEVRWRNKQLGMVERPEGGGWVVPQGRIDAKATVAGGLLRTSTRPTLCSSSSSSSARCL